MEGVIYIRKIARGKKKKLESNRLNALAQREFRSQRAGELKEVSKRMWGPEEERRGRDPATGRDMNSPKKRHLLGGGKWKSNKPPIF